MSNQFLQVWHDATLVGKLWQNATGQIGFQYEKKWVDDGFALSQQLPLTTIEYQPAASKAHQFFANLLPEANARAHILRDLKISDGDYELLKAIGGECAGALSILPADHAVNLKPSYKKLSEEDLKKLLLRKGNIASLTSEKNRPRLSLAGAQDKCPILYNDGDYFLPQDASPSTHILKFEVANYRHIPAYEYFLTQLAKKINLPVVHCELKKCDGHYFLLIERYDRIIQKNKIIQRLHQEDFCQALGVNYTKKYQQEGGPSFCDAYELLKNVSAHSIIDSENLLKWQLFNIFAGNSDGHAKNLALIYNQNQQVQLAPFYDLVCTRAIERIDSSLAMSVGGEFNPDNITKKHWEKFSESSGIGKNYLNELLTQTAETLLNQVSLVKKEFEDLHGSYPALERVQLFVTKRCRKALKNKMP